MQVAADSLKNEVYVGEINSAIAKVKNGSSISEALKESKYFPKVVYQTIAVGEETGSTDKILIKLTEFYEEEVSNFTRGVSDLILPVIMVIIGIAVGLMFYTVIVPISEISNTIQ
jgi:type IV pilus assembly protein PilC